MRIKGTIIAPALLTLGTLGAVLAGPVTALTAAVAPSATAVAAGSMSPNISFYHG